MNPNQDEVLEEEIDENYDPDDSEIKEYAQYLGFSLPEDEKLLYLAKEGLKAPLPKNWKPCRRKNGEIYYFNFETGESKWEHPCDEYYKNLFQQLKEEQNGKKKPVKMPMLYLPNTNPTKKEVLMMELDFKKKREEYIRKKEEELSSIKFIPPPNNADKEIKKYKDQQMGKTSTEKLAITKERINKLNHYKNQIEKEQILLTQNAKDEYAKAKGLQKQSKYQQELSKAQFNESTTYASTTSQIDKEIQLLLSKQLKLQESLKIVMQSQKDITNNKKLIKDEYQQALSKYKQESNKKMDILISNVKKEALLFEKSPQNVRVKNEATLQMQNKVEEYTQLKQLQLKQEKQAYERTKADRLTKEESKQMSALLHSKNKADSDINKENSELLSKMRLDKVNVTQQTQKDIDIYKEQKESDTSQSMLNYEELKKIEYQAKEMELGKLATDIKSMQQLAEQVSSISSQNQEKKQSVVEISRKVESVKDKEKQMMKSIEVLKGSLGAESKSYLVEEIINLDRVLKDIDKSIAATQNPLPQKKAKTLNQRHKKTDEYDEINEEFKYKIN